ncbi:MAG: hypothetical protein ACE5WD_03550 [Candidatus Aminicenantia bacterium]
MLLTSGTEAEHIQQSFYGSKDPSIYYNWRFNPVQGGDIWGNFSRIIKRNFYGDSVYVQTKPLDWKPYESLAPLETPCYMEQWITLREDVAQIVYRFTYYGSKNHVIRDQEMPALYFIEYLSTLAYYKNGSIRYKYRGDIPINNGNGENAYLINDEYWAAYVNNAYPKWGCGVLTPGTNRITYFRSTGGGGSGGFATSYFAPLRRYALTRRFKVQYTTYLYIADVPDIRAKFNNIRKNGLQLAYNGNFEKKSGSNPYKWFKATDAGGSHLYHTSGGEWVYDGKCSVALTAQSKGAWELPYFYQTQNGVTGKTEYKISFRYRCQNLYNGAAGIRIIQFDRRGRLLSDSGIMPVSKVSGNQQRFLKKEFKFTTHRSAATIEIRLQLNSLDSWARVWFDSVKFKLANP